MGTLVENYLDSLGEIERYSQAEELSLLKLYKENPSKKRLAEMIPIYQHIIIKESLKYKNFDLDIMDLIQEGNLILIELLYKYQFKRNNSIKSYLHRNIFRSLQNYFINNFTTIRYPLNTIKDIVLSNYMKNTTPLSNYTTMLIVDENYTELLTSETKKIARKNVNLLLSDEEILDHFEIIDDSNKYYSTPFLSIDNFNLNQFYQDSVIEMEILNDAMKDEIRAALDTLNDKEKAVLKMYFGVDHEYSLTLAEIGEELGVTRERARQIREKALRKLRFPWLEKKLKDYPSEAISYDFHGSKMLSSSENHMLEISKGISRNMNEKQKKMYVKDRKNTILKLEQYIKPTQREKNTKYKNASETLRVIILSYLENRKEYVPISSLREYISKSHPALLNTLEYSISSLVRKNKVYRTISNKIGIMK
tara:strand:+ start:2092 stop:3357 length:1266 start_codon:yes stop_codon:yes gene_type:complete